MTRVICVANQKGGVGKTNLSVNLPAFLAAKGKKILLVDFDHQANATYSLGLDPKVLPLSVYHALIGQVTPSAIIRKTPFFGYEIMPSSPDLAGATVELVDVPNREFKLKELLERVKDNYDFVFVDSPPSLGLLTINAFTAADEVLIPVQAEYLAVEGLEQLMKTIELVRKNIGHNLEIGGAVLTMYNKRNKVSKLVEEELREKFPGYVFNTIIPRAVVLAEAPRFGKTVLQYAPASKAAQTYRLLAEELLNRYQKPL